VRNLFALRPSLNRKGRRRCLDAFLDELQKPLLLHVYLAAQVAFDADRVADLFLSDLVAGAIQRSEGFYGFDQLLREFSVVSFFHFISL